MIGVAKMIPELNKIYQGDCLEIMKTWPDKCVDITITSPPYNTLFGIRNSGLHKNNAWVKKAQKGYSLDADHNTEGMDEDKYQKFINSVVSECLRISKGLVWINHKIRYRKKQGIHPLRFLNFPIYCEIIWARDGSLAMNNKRFALSHEYIYGFGTPHFWDDALNTKMTVWHVHSPPQGFDHPCPYPEALISPLIVSSCPENGIVFDPFIGTGTTAIAAVKRNRSFVGIEIMPNYIKIAQHRIDLEMAQGKLF